MQIEQTGQFMLSAFDLQPADGPPPGRVPGQPLGPEADLRVGPGVQETCATGEARSALSCQATLDDPKNRRLRRPPAPRTHTQPTSGR